MRKAIAAGVFGCLLLLADHGMLAQAERDNDPANLRGERVRAVEAQPLDVDRGAKGVAGLLKKLGTRASLMMIVAHPDDEDGGMLTYESRGVGARVGMLTLTRGEGGQNVMSGDFNDALGLVRTRELLAADRYLGVDQMFGTEVDFGFSKTKEEAFSQWTRERVLYDAVRAVRLYRPLVVTSVFLGAPTDGHGHHQVSGEVAQEVFNAAADPKVFPEMGLPPWAPAKVYGRMPFAQVGAGGMFDYATGKMVPVQFQNYVTGRISHSAPEPTVMVPEGDADPLLGMTYVQFARRGLALQKTQIGSGARLAPVGRVDVGYTRYGSRVSSGAREYSFFAGIDVSLAGIVGLAPALSSSEAKAMRESLDRLQHEVAAQSKAFSMEHPEASAPGLCQFLHELDALIAHIEKQQALPPTQRYDLLHELRIKRVQANEALVRAEGLELVAEATSAKPALAGGKIEVRVRVSSAAKSPLTISHREWLSFPAEIAAAMMPGGSTASPAHGSLLDEVSGFQFPLDTPPTKPYFSRANVEQPLYRVDDARLRNAPLTPPPLSVHVTVLDGDVAIDLERVVGYTTGIAASSVYQPVLLVPAVSVEMQPPAAIVPLGEKSFVSQIGVVADASAGGRDLLHVKAPAGWEISPSELPLATAAERKMIPFSVVPGALGEQTYVLRAEAVRAGQSFSEGYHAVGYLGIVRDNLYRPATAQVRGVALAVPAALKVAYLPGTGDAVEAMFAEMGIAATRVSVAEIAGGKLSGYDALVMGVRAYAAHQDLPGVTPQIVAFARAGGAVVVQYNTAEFSGAEAPYPMSLGVAEKVVEEHAPVRLLEPGSQLLRWPNRISEHDFDGWVEERGHGFMEQWDPRYVAVTEVHDAGQDPQRGGLLVAQVGKGVYVYCAYALYRQLPEGVPGAFRLLANLVSLGRRP